MPRALGAPQFKQVESSAAWCDTCEDYTVFTARVESFETDGSDAGVVTIECVCVECDRVCALGVVDIIMEPR